MNEFLKISGDYKNWNVYRKSVVICDVTEYFIRKYTPHLTRTGDQMRQAARSCKQNIVEGISDSTVSQEICIKLLGVARGSIRELREDYEDYLRQNNLETWDKHDPRVAETRHYCITHDDPSDFVAKCQLRADSTIANIMVTMICQLDAMLSKVLLRIQSDFLRDGGIREAMTRARLASRKPNNYYNSYYNPNNTNQNQNTNQNNINNTNPHSPNGPNTGPNSSNPNSNPNPRS
jgi:four helix bundle suffix protein